MIRLVRHVVFVIVCIFCSLTAFSQFTFTLPSNVSTGTVLTVTVAGPKDYTGTATITSTDAGILLHTSSLAFAAGTATFDATFKTTGKQSITLKDAATNTGTASTNVVSSSAAALTSCGSCYATVGAGAVLTSSNFGDYNNSSNVLTTTHLGNGSPQFAAGIAYKLPIRSIPPLYHHNDCNQDKFSTPITEGQAAYCYPFKAFISLKFSPDASQTFGGFTYGISHALHKNLDVMLGISFSGYNEVSPGFQQAALNTVRTQQAAGNKYYSQFDPAALQANTPTAFDGFPTQLKNADGTTGALIYTGNPLVLHYHSGFFVGVSLPFSLKSSASGTY